VFPFSACVVQGLQQATWPEAFAAIRKAAAAVKGSEMRAVAGRLADAESMVTLKDMFNRLGAGDLRVSRGGGRRGRESEEGDQAEQAAGQHALIAAAGNAICIARSLPCPAALPTTTERGRLLRL
jgi:hypothetical protein